MFYGVTTIFLFSLTVITIGTHTICVHLQHVHVNYITIYYLYTAKSLDHLYIILLTDGFIWRIIILVLTLTHAVGVDVE